MLKFPSLSNYTYQINNTLNVCVKYMFCILCIVMTSSPNKISVLFIITTFDAFEVSFIMYLK